MQKLAILAVILSLASFSANADAIYYCNKNGKKIVTDRPCEDLGAQEKKRINPEDLPPLSTSRGLTANQIEQSKQIDQRYHQQSQIDDQQRQIKQQAAQSQKANNKAVCVSLDRQKQSIISAQRAPNSGAMHDYYREQRRKIDDEIYRLGCETM